MRPVSYTPYREISPVQHIQGLDGIRALAVLAVIFFHADIHHFVGGGFLGVDVFFTLSGFLITSLLLAELKKNNGIDFLRFYIRRFKRLLPALYALLLLASIYTYIFAPDAIEALRRDIPAALLYYSNLWQLLDQQSYFEGFGRPHALQHLWSLAIEEQFYIVWPVLLLLLYRLRRVLPLFVSIAALALASAAWMWWLAEARQIPIAAAPERLYLASDTHVHGLLFGALLASFYRPNTLRQAWQTKMVALLGGVALLYLLLALWFLTEAEPFLYRGGFVGVAFATMLLIVSASSPNQPINYLFKNKGLDWIGKRSYALYLWHWPVFVYLRPGEELSSNIYLAFAIRLALTFVLAELSYRWVEQPIRRARWRDLRWPRRSAYGLGLSLMAAAIAVLYMPRNLHFLPMPEQDIMPIASDAEVLAQAAAGKRHAVSAMSHSLAIVAPAPEEGQAALGPSSAVSFVDLDAQSEQVLDEAAQQFGAYQLEADAVWQAQTGAAPLVQVSAITALGDSVMLGARPALARRLPISYMDAQVGRQASGLLKVLREMKAKQAISPLVLIHIGTNGYIYEANLRKILGLLEDAEKVLLINIFADRRWAADNNALLQRFALEYPNVEVLDWESRASAHPEYFVKDGVHLNSAGMAAYADMVHGRLNLPEHFARPTLYVVPPENLPPSVAQSQQTQARQLATTAAAVQAKKAAVAVKAEKPSPAEVASSAEAMATTVAAPAAVSAAAESTPAFIQPVESAAAPAEGSAPAVAAPEPPARRANRAAKRSPPLGTVEGLLN